MKQIDLSISIVSYNTKALLRRCLKSIFKHSRGLKLEVFVIDNASADGSAAMVKAEFPQVKLIRNRINCWYTSANNQTLKLAHGRYFLILNSDVFLTTNACKVMTAYLDSHPQVGAIEPLQLYADGRIAPTGSRHNSPLTDFYELTWIGRKLANPKLLNHFRLKIKNRRHTWPAEVICDAALMVRTQILRDLGGYNEKLKLYYTENDLCRRIQQAGFSTVHFGEAMVKHTVSASTNKQAWQTISAIYAADAWHYFRRWHGLVPTGLLYFSLKLNNLAIDLVKHKWPFVLIFILAAVLRFWRLPELMPFIGDFGHDYLAAKDLLTTGKIPLVGIASSVPWLYQGSLWIYLAAVALWLGNFHPVAPAVLTGILSLITLWTIIAIAWKHWGKLAAVASGLIFAASPLAVVHARTPWHTSPIPLVAIGYFYFLLKRSAFWSAFFFSLLFQFELSNFPLIILLARIRFNKFVLIGLLIPLLPKIIYDFTHGFTQLGGFALWIGYRIAAFFGYRGLHAVSLDRLVTTTQIIFDYLQKFFPWGWVLIAWTLRRPKTPAELLTVSWLLITVIAFYVHGTPSEAYFPVLFPILSLAVGWGISHRKFLVIPLIVLSLVNSWWLYHHRFGNSGLSLSERLIIADTPEALIRTGPGSEHATFLDNYYYLIWWKNRQP